jgi:hypothetical protein
MPAGLILDFDDQSPVTFSRADALRRVRETLELAPYHDELSARPTHEVDWAWAMARVYD